MEFVRKTLAIFYQSQTDRESVAEEFNYFIHPKPIFTSLCCTFLFPILAEQAAEFGHFVHREAALDCIRTIAKKHDITRQYWSKKSRRWNC